jgi:hypothetical protein
MVTGWQAGITKRSMNSSTNWSNTMKIHPNAPPRLVKKFHNSGSFHKLADEIEVNVKWIHGLITQGIEPTDRTEKGRDIRARLYLPRRKRKPGKPRTKATPVQKAIRQMVRETKEAIS